MITTSAQSRAYHAAEVGGNAPVVRHRELRVRFNLHDWRRHKSALVSINRDDSKPLKPPVTYIFRKITSERIHGADIVEGPEEQSNATHRSISFKMKGLDQSPFSYVIHSLQRLNIAVVHEWSVGLR